MPKKPNNHKIIFINELARAGEPPQYPNLTYTSPPCLNSDRRCRFLKRFSGATVPECPGACERLICGGKYGIVAANL
ncbi:MAG TPA: hypothetical protein PLM14_03680, partial [Candidatus Hydrogenedentes bacterium]|nr:hypothetical protein [Candidatus Hydrogenedentota bacterium]